MVPYGLLPICRLFQFSPLTHLIMVDIEQSVGEEEEEEKEAGDRLYDDECGRIVRGPLTASCRHQCHDNLLFLLV